MLHGRMRVRFYKLLIKQWVYNMWIIKGIIFRQKEKRKLFEFLAKVEIM
jgi:hypothetical protein